MRNMKVVKIATDALIPYAGNARTHSEEQIAQIANSINEFGWTNPILIKPDKTVIAGHGRLLAAKKIGIETVPCVVLNDLSDEQCRALVIADNKLALNAGWDLDLLASGLAELKNIDFDLSVTGFSDAELNDIFAGLEKDEASVEDDFDADSAAEEIAEPISKNGDVWILGSHRLMCGDCTNEDNLKKLITDGVVANMLFVDSPYNMKLLPKKIISKKKYRDMKNNDLPKEEFKLFILKVLSVVKSINAKANYICCNWKFYDILVQNMDYSACIVWAKDSFSLGRGYRHQHEFILFNGYIHKNITNETDLWKIAKTIDYKHPTQKPVALPTRAIKNSTNEGDIVLDIFGGSGSTLIACEQTNRICRMMEIDPIYCDVIVKRWETLTGKKAVLENGSKRKKPQAENN